MVDIPEVRILVHPEPIRVSYQKVRQLVPSFWGGADPGEGGDGNDEDQEEKEKEEEPFNYGLEGRHIDAAIHIGMAGPRPMWQIERRGHRQGYKSKDVDGKLLDDEAEGGHSSEWVWYGCPDELETELDTVDVMKRWQASSPVSRPLPSLPFPPFSCPSSGGACAFHDSFTDSRVNTLRQHDLDLRISDDAGRYLCDFIYYSSLAHLWKQQRPRKVLFFHVPAEATERNLETGRELLLNLVRAVVESEVTRRRG